MSAMKYELHRCTVEHLKRKARQVDDSEEDIDLQEMDLGDFKTVDSIGDVDGEEGMTIQVRNELKFDDDIPVESALDDDEFDSSASVGQEFVNKVEVNYCSLCREYLSRGLKDDKIIADHCKSKKHLKWYYQSKKKDEKELLKAKRSSGESSEALKDAVTSTSPQEGDKASKKAVPSEKELNAVEENGKETKGEAEDVTLAEREGDEEASASPKKFKRLTD